MNRYRSLETVPAVQYLGEPIEGVTCDGSSTNRDVAIAARGVNGCDPSRAHFPHVHTQATGGLQVLQVGDWITPHPGGPFRVMPDAWFRARFEVPSIVGDLNEIDAIIAEAEAPAIEIQVEPVQPAAADPIVEPVVAPPAKADKKAHEKK